MDRKMLEAYDDVLIPVPLGLTPAEEAEAIARFKAEYPPEVVAEWNAQIEAVSNGEDRATVSLAELIEELKGKPNDAKRPA